MNMKSQNTPRVVLGGLLDCANVQGDFDVAVVASTDYVDQIEG